MKIIKLTLLLLMVVFVLPSLVIAEQQVRTIEYPIKYIAQTEPRLPYMQLINLTSPDGISKILSFEIELYGDYDTQTIVEGLVDDGKKPVSCFPNTWTTPIAFSYLTKFDCTKLIVDTRRTSTISESLESSLGKDPLDLRFTKNAIGFRTNQISRNLYGNLKVTYLTKSKATMEIFGTEYDRGEDKNAKVWLQLLNDSGIDYINNAICQIDIYTPNMKTYIEKATMTFFKEGIYYYDLSVPIMDGVYPVVAECFYDASQVIETADSDWINNGTLVSGSYFSTRVNDGTDWNVKEDNFGGGVRRIEVGLNFTNIILPTINTTLGLTIGLEDTNWNSVSNDDITIYIKNQTDGTWIELPNKIISQSGRHDYSNSISAIQQNLTELGYVSNNGEVDLRFEDNIAITSGANSNLKLDYVYVSINVAGDGKWQNVKGNSEIHITGEDSYQLTMDYGTLTNETFEGYMYVYYIVASATHEFVEDADVHLNLWKQFDCDHIVEVYIQNDSGDWNNVTWYGTIDSSKNDRCQVHYYQNLTNGTNYNIKIKSKTYWKTELLGMLGTARLNREVMYDGCVYYQQNKSLPNYTIPLTSQPSENDTFYLACQYYLNSFYNFNHTLMNDIILYPNESTNFTSEQMDSMEAVYKHILDMNALLEGLMGGIINLWNQGNDYSQTILGGGSTQPALLLFANVSGNQINYNSIISSNTTPQEIWEYYNRTLSSFDFEVNATANINNTAIAEAVWSWQGSIVSNILNLFTNSIWSAIDRNLTYYAPASVNNTEVSNAVWNNSGRYIHGEII